MVRSLFLLACLWLAAMSTGNRAEAAALIDQQVFVDPWLGWVSSGPGTGNGRSTDSFQTVKAGISGKLTALSLQIFNGLYRTEPIEISIIENVAVDDNGSISGQRSNAIFTPASTLLAHQDFYDRKSMFVDVSDLDVFVNPGEKFAIYLD